MRFFCSSIILEATAPPPYLMSFWDTSKNLCLAKDKAKAEQEELDIHDTA